MIFYTNEFQSHLNLLIPAYIPIHYHFLFHLPPSILTITHFSLTLPFCGTLSQRIFFRFQIVLHFVLHIDDSFLFDYCCNCLYVFFCYFCMYVLASCSLYCIYVICVGSTFAGNNSFCVLMSF